MCHRIPVLKFCVMDEGEIMKVHVSPAQSLYSRSKGCDIALRLRKSVSLQRTGRRL